MNTEQMIGVIVYTVHESELELDHGEVLAVFEDYSKALKFMKMTEAKRPENYFCIESHVIKG